MMEYRLLLTVISLIVSARAQNDVPGTSTDASTTVSSSTTTTTTKAPTTSRVPPSTTPTPPAPSTEVPTWTVKSSNSTCILLRGNFTFAVTYQTPSGDAISDKVDIPTTATATGSCAPFVNSLVLTWSQGNVTFMFIKAPVYNSGVDSGNGSYSLTSIFGRLTVGNPNDGGNSTSGQTFYISVREPGFMTTPLHNSYSCESYQSLAADKTGSVYLEMKGIQLEAFHDGLGPAAAGFSPNQPCTKDTLSSVLPIVGYSALGVLAGAAVGYVAWKKLGRSGYMEV